MSCNTPILLLVFNRPDLTKELIKSLEYVKPKSIYVVADGPRENNGADIISCKETRELFENLPWECSVNKLYRQKNLGCAKSVSRGISWFFEKNEQGIILEDDCIADPSFFPFCEALLEKYKFHENIYHISGNNFQFGNTRGSGDYYFSIFNHLWGWATWKRAWLNFDFEIQEDAIPEMIPFIRNRRILEYFSKQFKLVIDNSLDSWGFRWTFACWRNKGMSILPNKNLVSNIGFGPNATHTVQEGAIQSNLPTEAVKFPLKHPARIIIDQEADRFSFRKIFQPRRKLRYYIGTFKQKIFGT